MSEKTVLFYDKVKQVWQEIAQDGSLDGIGFQLDVYKKMLSFFQVGDFYYFIFDVKKGDFEYLNPNINKVLGYQNDISALEFINNIHPEDQPYFISFEKSLNVFFRNLPLDKITKYKIQYDFRIRDINKKYKRILHQMMIIQHDDEKNLLRSLGIHTDISHLKSDGKPKLSYIAMDDGPSYQDINPEETFSILLPQQELFTKKEKIVLKLVIEGKTTKEIAEQLCNSIHTINTHRKNIFQKTETKTVADLVNNCIKNNWI
jgi:DNA-binding CsgD family transcriptional regulator